MSDLVRTITLVVKTAEKYPDWILKSHLSGPVNGIKVIKIQDGDAIKKLEQAYDEMDSEAIAEIEEMEA